MQQEQRKLLLQNTALVNYARLQGFDVIDTFNMTMGRYKDFLQGQCACHFHRVSRRFYLLNLFSMGVNITVFGRKYHEMSRFL